MLWPPPATQQGKKNARAREVSLSFGMEGASIDRAGAARAFGTGGKRIVCQPLGLVSTPGLSVALDNCIGANGATMLRNTYIISRGDSSVSVLRSH